MRNANLEKQLKALEHTIGLLIQHRASVHELDRKKRKKKKVLRDIPVSQLLTSHRVEIPRTLDLHSIRIAS